MNAFNISLVILNYNYAAYLRDAIDSALQQSQPFFEIIVVDDGSTDSSREIIKSYSDSIRGIIKENGGQASAMNTGFDAAGGDWIWFLDADDYLFPNSVKMVGNSLKDELGMIYGQLLRVTADRKILGPCLTPPHPLPEGDLFPSLTRHGTAYLSPTSGLIFRRSLLKKHMPIPEKEFLSCADDYMRIAMAVSVTVGVIEEPIAAFRVHKSSDQARINYDIIRMQKYVTASGFAYQKVLDQALKRSWPSTPDRAESYSRLALFRLILHSCKSFDLHERPAFAFRALRSTWKDPRIVILKKVHRSAHILGITLSPPSLVSRVNIFFLSLSSLFKQLLQKK